MTLAEFLLARIAEDEAEVHRWQAAMDADEIAARGVPSWVIMAGGLKIPAHVLAECEAKRRIVVFCDPSDGYEGYILRALAAVYADHPDFREEWRAD